MMRAEKHVLAFFGNLARSILYHRGQSAYSFSKPGAYPGQLFWPGNRYVAVSPHCDCFQMF